jgi:heptaprenyl diphosphate synthase
VIFSEAAELFPLVHHRISAAVDDLDASPTVQEAVRELVMMPSDEEAMLSVPLLVHAAETGDPKPAVPISSIHLLWWNAAHVFDDFIDGGQTNYSRTLPSGTALMAAVVCGSSLPMNIATRDFPATLIPGMVGEFFSAWTFSNDGQIRDLNGTPGGTSRDAILQTYRHKNGVPYGAVCAMAAYLAGVEERRVALWRQFGTILGLVGQFRNDQEDLVTGRDEDLANGTATYLLSHLLNTLSLTTEKAEVIDLVGRACRCDEARSRLKTLMLRPATLEGYFDQITSLRDKALDTLGHLGRDNPYLNELHRIVCESSTMLPPLQARLANVG